MASKTLFIDSTLVDTPCTINGVPLKMAVNRYTASSSSAVGGITLLLLHASGSHKEQWEPIIENLFKLHLHRPEEQRIREAWAFDSLTHGDSAVANSAVLDPSTQVGLMPDWAEAIAAFVKERLWSHRIVTIGHSSGAITSLLSLKCYENISHTPYELMIIVEPAMGSREAYNEDDEANANLEFLFRATSALPEQWPSRAMACQWMSKRIPWKVWDDRIRHIYVNKGLRPMQTVDGPVVPKCTRQYEAAIYKETPSNFVAIEVLGAFCQKVPIHIVFGEDDIIVPKHCNDSVIDSSKGRHLASVTYLPGAGHLAIQEQPDGVATVLHNILGLPRPKVSSRL